MNLAIFDIDGTLTDTNQVDAACYLQAAEQEFGIKGADDDWSQYAHATDPGILHELCLRHRGQAPSGREILAFQARFLANLKEENHRRPDLFREIKGAGALLDWLEASPDWRAALATGGWAVTARFKLQAARLPGEDLPFASGDDGIARQDILRSALIRARDRHGRFQRVVSIGDGVWDVRAAGDLGLAFIGVGDTRKLGQAGADRVISDFSDLPACLELLECAAGPISRL